MYYLPIGIHIYGTQSAPNGTQSMQNGTHCAPAGTQSVLQVGPLTRHFERSSKWRVQVAPNETQRPPKGSQGAQNRTQSVPDSAQDAQQKVTNRRASHLPLLLRPRSISMEHPECAKWHPKCAKWWPNWIWGMFRQGPAYLCPDSDF